MFERLFQSIKISTSITEVYPADTRLHLDRDAYLTVKYPEGLPVIIWFDKQIKSLLRFRVVIFKSEELEELSEKDMEFLKDANQQLMFFGAISTGGLNITLEYKLPYGEKILASTIILIVKYLSENGKAARNVFS